MIGSGLIWGQLCWELQKLYQPMGANKKNGSVRCPALSGTSKTNSSQGDAVWTQPDISEDRVHQETEDKWPVCVCVGAIQEHVPTASRIDFSSDKYYQIFDGGEFNSTK